VGAVKASCMPRHAYSGSCHCGNLALELESDRTPDQLHVRTDSCSFCRKHHALYVSDPEGAVHIAVREEKLVQRYRFGTKTADFLLCTACGVFVAAYTEEPALAVVNVNVLDARDSFLVSPSQVVDLDGESLAERVARRRAKWTPVASFALPSRR
jgi:hypothetical protein